MRSLCCSVTLPLRGVYARIILRGRAALLIARVLAKLMVSLTLFYTCMQVGNKVELVFGDDEVSSRRERCDARAGM